MKKLLKRRPVDIFLDLLTVLLLTVSLFPLYYMIVQSVVDWKFVDKTVIPSHFSLASYDYLFHTTNANDAMMWLRALGNSLLVCVPVTLVALSVGLLAGYAMTKLKNFNRKQIIFNMLLFEMFFPVIMRLVPKYVILKGMANSYAGMIVPTMISTWAIFMYINFFKTLPDEIIGTRPCYPEGPTKLEKLKDCAFTSGIVFRPDGRVDLYSGLCDCEEGRITIDNPFPAHGGVA